MRRLAQILARAGGRASRRLGRGGGTSLPGVILLRLRPAGLAELAAQLPDGCTLISATNGKTTTARMVAGCLRRAGGAVVANTAGANLASGIATALLDGPDATAGVFEVDEAALPRVAAETAPRVVVLMNLFRDQLDRYGELEILAESWRETVAALDPNCVLALNADDPTIATLAPTDRRVIFFGVDDSDHRLATLPAAADAVRCGACGAELEYDVILLSHLGHWRCPGCGRRRPTADVSVRRATLRGSRGQSIAVQTPSGPLEIDLPLPGLHNAYNAAAAVAAAHALGVERAPIAEALAATNPAFGRAERLVVGERELLILLAKNPTGVNQNLRLLAAEPGLRNVMICLNDRTADGHDVSWIWDVDYEPLVARLDRVTLTGGRAHDLALRLLYGGMRSEAMTVETDIADALDHALAVADSGETVFVLPTYTAMLELRTELVRRGVAQEFWHDR